MNYPEGTQLIRDIVFSKHRITITIGSDGNQAKADDKTAAGNKEGSSGIVFFDSNSDISILTINPENGGRSEPMKRPSYIGLGHELVHAYGYVTGSRLSGKATHTYLDANGEAVTVESYNEELTTVGLNDGRPYTENELRTEHGLWRRGTYDK